MVEYHPYLFLAVFLGVAILFAIAPLALAALWSRKFSPSKPGPDKNDVYECGLKSKGDAWIQFRSDYYIYAIIFLIFDVETIFLFPFAVAFMSLPVGRIRCHDGFFASAGRRPGLGVEERRFDLEMKHPSRSKRK